MERTMSITIPRAYEPGGIEKKWYDFWLERGYFTPRIDHGKKPFVVIMPPANVTGKLHLGHALTDTLEDIMVRWHRMKGAPTLWLPGTDHAGIATQVVTERKLARQGLSKNDLGIEEFLKAAWEGANESREAINRQHQMLGVSCDWSRERFTLDEGPSRAVNTAFVRLYNKSLIYRGERMINWCPRCQTALSDLEVEHKDIAGHLYYIRYALEEGDGFITVATTRPETFFGDTAVAVNPEDVRYKSSIGKNVVLPFINRKIPVIADDAVDFSFGTGALKITPAHDPTDFEVAERHKLPSINVIEPDATMNDNAGSYRGMERFACREQVIVALKSEGLLEKIEPYLHSVGHCNRCQTMVEPRVSWQWFVRTKPLAEKAISVVEDGSITIIPERFTKVYFRWMENIKDWCISRQLWWGHRIPVWSCQDCGKLTAAVDEPSCCIHCGSKQLVRDPDVLDTWFSSALWTHSTLGWPGDTEDLRYFYPTSVMETGYDILFFWVARMIMMGLEDTGEVPFRSVYLHGLLRDENGEKMSKLRGNVLDPSEMIEEYGVDALRFALTTGSFPGNDINLGKGKLKSSRNFVNKLWNTTRFILQNLDRKRHDDKAPLQEEITAKSSLYQGQEAIIEDRWIMSQLNRLVLNVDALMAEFQFGEAAQQIYDFVWSKFCDWYIEIAKIRFRSSQPQPSPLPVLTSTLDTSLRLLHPFMPFVTEELWQNLRMGSDDKAQTVDSIMIAPYPVASTSAIDPEAERAMACVMDIVRSIRNARAERKVNAEKWIAAEIYATDLLPYLDSQKEMLEKLARVNPLSILSRHERKTEKEEALVLVLREVEVLLPLSGMIDLTVEKERLEKESSAIESIVQKLEQRLQDANFLSKAPPLVREKEKQKLDALEDKLERLRQELLQLPSE